MNTDPNLVKALDFAEKNSPCVVIVDDDAALEIAIDYLRRNGLVFSLKTEFTQDEKTELVRLFDECKDLNSFMVLTKQAVSLDGWPGTRCTRLVDACTPALFFSLKVDHVDSASSNHLGPDSIVKEHQ